jgi:VanZ family protein
MIRTAGSEIRLDYMMHFCEYGLLALLAFLSLVNIEFKMTLKKYLITAAFLILLAVLDELHQKLIPGRSFNVEDILSNITGILAGLIFCVLIFRKIARRLKDQS